MEFGVAWRIFGTGLVNPYDGQYGRYPGDTFPLHLALIALNYSSSETAFSIKYRALAMRSEE
jgi:hypothetical protein